MTTMVRPGKPARRQDVWFRQVGEENAVYDPRAGTLHLMNDTALAIWELCDGETVPNEMVMAVCQVSGLPSEVVEEDVRRILTDFEQAGLLNWVP